MFGNKQTTLDKIIGKIFVSRKNAAPMKSLERSGFPTRINKIETVNEREKSKLPISGSENWIMIERTKGITEIIAA